MERLALEPGEASAFVYLLGAIVLYFAVLTVWSHIKAPDALADPRNATGEEGEVRETGRWIHRVARLHAIGWVLFAWGTLSLGLVQEGVGFLEGRLPLFTLWIFSPFLIYGLVSAYWTWGVRLGARSKPKS